LHEVSSFHVIRLHFENALQEPHLLIGKTTLRDGARLERAFSALRTPFSQPNARLWQEHALLDLFRAALWQKTHEARQSDELMARIARELENRATEKIDLAEVARRSGLSPSEFSRRFLAAQGQTPSRWVQMKRLETARALLLDTDWTLDHIAARSGFGTGFYLSRVWSKTFGHSPSRFRRTHRA
jgi:AraC-like DNA-binding protein